MVGVRRRCGLAITKRENETLVARWERGRLRSVCVFNLVSNHQRAADERAIRVFCKMQALADLATAPIVRSSLRCFNERAFMTDESAS